MKARAWFTFLSANVRMTREIPVPDSPGEPPSKRLDSAARPRELAATPRAASASLDPGLLLSSQSQSAVPTGFTEHSFWDKFDEKMTAHMSGLETRLGQRLDDHDRRLGDHQTHLAQHDEHNAVQDGKIDDLATRTAKLESMLSSKLQSITVSGRPARDFEKEAFLGGFLTMPKTKLTEKAKAFVGNPTGLYGIIAPANVGNFVLVKFRKTENMEASVSGKVQRAETTSLRLKASQPPESPAEKKKTGAIRFGKESKHSSAHFHYQRAVTA